MKCTIWVRMVCFTIMVCIAISAVNVGHAAASKTISTESYSIEIPSEMEYYEKQNLYADMSTMFVAQFSEINMEDKLIQAGIENVSEEEKKDVLKYLLKEAVTVIADSVGADQDSISYEEMNGMIVCCLPCKVTGFDSFYFLVTDERGRILTCTFSTFIPNSDFEENCRVIVSSVKQKANQR